MTNNYENNNKLNIDFALELMIKKFDRQCDAINSLESKVGILLGFVGVISCSTIVLIPNEYSKFGLNLFSLGLILIYLILIILIEATKTRDYLDPPDFPTFYSEKTLNKDNIEIKNQVIADIIACYEKNNEVQVYKSKLFNIAIFIFAISVLLIFLGILKE